MKSINLFVIAAFMSFYSLCGQTNLTNRSSLNLQGTLYGIVTDCDSGDPMQNVTVQANGAQQFIAETDVYGYYEMLVEDGVYNVEFIRIDYDTLLILDTTVVTGSMTEINAGLCEYPYPVQNVVATKLEDGTNMVTWDPPSGVVAINYKDDEVDKQNLGGVSELSNNRDFLNYSLARVSNFDPCLGPESGTLTPIGLTTALSFHDLGIGGLPPGSYAYAINARYSSSSSVWVYSNVVTPTGENHVTFTISLCNGDNPEGVVITMDEARCHLTSYQFITDFSGIATIDTILHGMYDISIDNGDYEVFEMDSVIIYSDTIFDVELIQKIYPPSKMYVDSITNIATWDEPDANGGLAEVINYYIYLDGIHIDSTNSDQLYYTFMGLTIGQTYNTCVEAHYACGVSEQSCYTWKSQVLFIPNNQKTSLINIFPNPAKDHITVKSTLPINYICVTNYVGQEVYSSIVNETKRLVLKTNTLQTGVYLVRIETDLGQLTQKMIIAR